MTVNLHPCHNLIYVLINIKISIFFCDLKKIDKNFKRKFKDIKFIDIRTVDNFLFRITNKKISIDSTTCSIYFENILKKKK